VTQLSRRRFLQLAGGGLALTTFRSFHPTIARAGSNPGSKPVPGAVASTVATPGDRSSENFSALFSTWHGSPERIPKIEVNIQLDDGSWNGWRALHVDHHVRQIQGAPTHFTPVLQPGIAFDVRAEDPADAALVQFSTGGALSDDAWLLGAPDDAEIPLIDGFIIPRARWGANENYRHQGQDPSAPIGWPPSYRDIERVVVHHTDTELGWENPAEVVRQIYYYHAVILDWTDIGYNFLIDVYGNVYEGRYGGPGVVGGHAFEYSRGSLGIAIIGNFNDASPPQATQESLVRLIRTRAPNVDSAVAADWLDWGDVPNICGHGDVIATDCPGTDVQAVLPTIRGQLAGSAPIEFPQPVRLYDPKILSFSAAPSLVDSDGLIELRATISQEGREPLLSQGPEPGFVYSESENFDSTGYAKIDRRFRLAVDVIGRDGVRNPYRWGFGEAIESGESREIVGYIRVEGMGARQLVPSIVQEYVGYYEEAAFAASIYVVHPLVSRASVDSSIGPHYVDATGHNVPAHFHEYWEEHGGLNRFGFPITEPFNERSRTDGTEYLTQYFERGRFEYHPELADKNRLVTLGLLGREATAMRHSESAFRPIEPFESTTEAWYFPETEHSTSYRFLEYWIEHGGLESFGYPISEKFEEVSLTDGRVRLVQYFERARFEYHPDDDWSKQIKLGHLGREILIRRGWMPEASEYS
jgi:hypothetical protein